MNKDTDNSIAKMPFNLYIETNDEKQIDAPSILCSQHNGKRKHISGLRFICEWNGKIYYGDHMNGRDKSFFILRLLDDCLIIEYFPNWYPTERTKWYAIKEILHPILSLSMTENEVVEYLRNLDYD